MFWNLSDGSQVEKTGEYEAKEGGFEIIPDDTKVLAAIGEIKWHTFANGDRVVNVKWQVVSENFKGRIIFQALKVFGTQYCKDKQKTSDKAKRMLGAIDANSGSVLPLDREPTDQDLMRMMGKIMGLHIKVYKHDPKNPDGPEKDGNYIAGISSKQSTPMSAPVSRAAVPMSQQANVQAQGAAQDGFDDDIPF